MEYEQALAPEAHIQSKSGFRTCGLDKRSLQRPAVDQPGQIAAVLSARQFKPGAALEASLGREGLFRGWYRSTECWVRQARSMVNSWAEKGDDGI